MLEAGDLEANLLEFRHKSFQFARLVESGGREFALFERTETESESRLRPRLVHLWVVVPRRSIVYDMAADLLYLSIDGVRPGPAEAGSAIESAAEAAEYRERGLEFRRVTLGPDAYLDLPTADADLLLSADGRAALDLG